MDGATALLLTTAELASRPDFRLEQAHISPSRRSIDGPCGTALVEPRVMQVLTVLAEAAGGVVTRDLLFRRCWGNPYVGDDSLNRAIAGVRRLASGAAADSFAIENIPRTGYRLTDNGSANGIPITEPEVSGQNVTRRLLLGGAALTGLGGLGAWITLRSQADPRSEFLIERGQRTLYSELPDGGERAAKLLEGAVQRDPRNAQGWGPLAFAYRDLAEGAAPAKISTAIEASERTARRALAIDPKEGNARAALAMLRPYLGEWRVAEDRLMSVLAVAPENVLAMNSLVPLLQGVGRVRSSYEWNEQVLEIDPNSPVAAYRRAIKLWQLGRLDEADQAIDRTMQL